MIHRARPGTSERRSKKRHRPQVFMINNKKCLVVVKEKDAKHKENLERREEPKDAVVDRDVKYINIFLIFS